MRIPSHIFQNVKIVFPRSCSRANVPLRKRFRRRRSNYPLQGLQPFWLADQKMIVRSLLIMLFSQLVDSRRYNTIITERGSNSQVSSQERDRSNLCSRVFHTRKTNTDLHRSVVYL